MAKVNLSELNVEGLMELRKQIDVMLDKRRGELQKQLERIALRGGERVARRGGQKCIEGQESPTKIS